MPKFGPTLREDGTLFRLWAPTAQAVTLLIQGQDPRLMENAGQGFAELFVSGAGAGTAYMFRVGDQDVPDPVSREQVADATGWSLVTAPLPPRESRRQRPWHESVIAEVHVGTASPEGTFAGLAKRLGHFRDAGFTALEIMPVADFMGSRNWGYDGVLPYAPDRSYGTPAEFRALVDAAHGHDIGIILDVVYNHFGPAGNFLNVYAKDFFTERFKTPWGAAIALDHPLVREFFLDNVRMWLDDYDIDGLRFDAIHAFRTEGAPTFLRAIVETARTIKPDAYLILENEDNTAHWLERSEAGKPSLFSAQWNDDMHHVLHVASTGESTGYYGAFAEGTPQKLARGLTDGFVYQGEPDANRKGEHRGEPSAHLPPDAFVDFLQNHDQIGNRPLGDRLVTAISPERNDFLRFVQMLCPHIPLLFQGGEADVRAPFPFFCDFEGELADAIRNGRKREFQAFFESHDGSIDDLPDPLAVETFQSAKLPWDRIEAAPALAVFKDLAAKRRALVWPLTASHYQGAQSTSHGDVLRVEWHFQAGRLTLALNPTDGAGIIEAPLKAFDASVGTATLDDGQISLGPWAAACWVEA